MTRIPEFRTGHSAASAHQALKTSLEILDQAQECAVLWFGEIMQRRLYSELGYGTMRAYALQELGFSSTRAGNFMRLAAKLAELPVLKNALAEGEVGYAKAVEIMPVVNAGNEAEWVKLTKEKPRTEVRTEVKRARKQAADDRSGQASLMPLPATPPAVVPVSINFQLTPGQYARYEAIMAQVKQRSGQAELLLAMAEALLTEQGDSNIARRRATPTPHYQVHIHECPTCAAKTVQTPRGKMALSATEAETANEDAEIHTPGQRNTTTIPPKTRREVLARDRHQCRRKGCQNTRYLQIHHVDPRSKGGSNEADNIVTLCTACHALWHEHGGDLAAVLSEVPPA